MNTNAEQLINGLLNNKSLKDLIEFIKSSIYSIINKNNFKEKENYNKTKFNPSMEYELLLQKDEQVTMENMSKEYKFKIQCEIYSKKINSLKEEITSLLFQIVSDIIIKIFYDRI